jgi:tRNA A-37 threonylcarbamoyl transferase component Bud32
VESSDDVEADGVLGFARSRLGQVLRGKYRLDQVLGVGGMGAVYAVTHRNRKRFAVKMLHPELSCIDDIRRRFLREGYVANSVNHPGAVSVLDDDIAEDGSAFLVMELLEGKSFEDLWESSGRACSIDALLGLFYEVLDVLSAAHAQGIVHRDLKPANLFLTDSGAVKVLDFGIARLLDTTGGGATQTGATMGTPAFMAPEQARGSSTEVDAQTDLWAVGATLFVLISGRLVHDGSNPTELLINAATRAAPALSSVIAVPPAVGAIVDRALSFDRKARWSSAFEMQQALGRAHRELFGTDLQNAPRPMPAAVVETARMMLGGSSLSLRAPATAGPLAQPLPARAESVAVPVVHVTRPGPEPRAVARPLLGRASSALLALLLVACVSVAFLVWGPGRRPSAGDSATSATAPEVALISSAAPSVALPVSSAPAASPSRRHATGSAALRPLGAGQGASAATSSPLCARLLERQSLGETLTSSEQAAFSQQCRK